MIFFLITAVAGAYESCPDLGAPEEQWKAWDEGGSVKAHAAFEELTGFTPSDVMHPCVGAVKALERCLYFGADRQG